MARKKKNIFELDDLAIDRDLAIDTVLGDFSDDEQARGTRETIWAKADSMYYGNLKAKSDPWIGCSNFAHPIVRIVCDTITDNLSYSFPTEIDLIKPIPVSNDDHTKTFKRGQLLNFQFKTEIKWDEIKQDLFQIATRYGDCFTKQYYDIRRREKTEREIEQELSTIQVEEGQPLPDIDPMTDVFHGVRMDVLNIQDVYKPGNSIGVQKDTCAHVICHTRMSRAQYDELVETQGYQKIDFEDSKEEDNGINETSGNNIDEKRKEQLGLSTRLKDNGNNMHLLEWYGAFQDAKTKKWQEIVIVIHPNTKTLCKAYVNKMSVRPIVQHSARANANQPYHEGYPEILRQIAHYLNTVYNQRRDSESKRIAQPGFYDSGSKFNPKNYTMKPNGMYPTQGPPGNSVHFLQFQGAPPELFSEESILKQLVEELTSVSDTIKAAQSPGDKSATEINHVVNKFDIRFSSVFSRFERSLMEVVEQTSELNRLYMKDTKEYRILGHNGKYTYQSVASSDMSEKFDVIFKGNSVSNEMVQFQKAMQTYSIGVANPLIATNPVYLYSNLRRLYEAMHVDRIDQLIPVPVQVLTRTPIEEHEFMYQGIQVPVQLNENAEEHWAQHQQEMDQLGWQEKTEPFIKAIFITHQNSTNGLKAAQLTARMSGTQSTVGPSAINPTNTAPGAPTGAAPPKPVGNK